jgi:hypothetical protein
MGPNARKSEQGEPVIYSCLEMGRVMTQQIVKGDVTQYTVE